MIKKLYGGRVLAFLAALFAAAYALGVPFAAGAEDPEYLVHYKQYVEALKDGDNENAAIHGLAAWTQAEEALGDHRLTAILAYNYGKLIIFDHAEEALKALQRAKELQRAGIADLPEAELNAYLDYAEYAQYGKRRQYADKLRDTLEAVGADGNQNADIAIFWLRLASDNVDAERFEAALADAEKAESVINAASPSDYRQKAQAILIKGIATIFRDNAAPDDILSANQLFIKAARLFPPQKDIKTFDELLAAILAWNNTAYVLLETKANYLPKNRETYTGSRIPLRLPESEISDPTKFSPFDYDAVFPESKSSEECNIVWEQRAPPRYPRQALQRGYIGSALIGYSLKDLKVHDPIILAEVPRKSFGQTALESMLEWRLARTPSPSAECTDNRLTTFSFELMP